MTIETTTSDARIAPAARIVSHPITGMLHVAYFNSRPQCNGRTKKLHRMVTIDRVLSASSEMFCDRCFGDAQHVRNNAANGRFQLAI
jgi:hypothetical protein